ncbi:hypothetical protein SAMN05216601_103196 [Ectopseudomonas composti]|uniref:Oxidoreductase molybdopterin-binding domain-containing protein n=1 Tax=Ectopseudomonas composti TaxID=658457 RepID=A0A1I5KYH7_9GAMM|nr:hypothetical protein SAMN05216601_103196 [Pseudomonas composti]
MAKDSSMSPLRHFFVTLFLTFLYQLHANAEPAPYPLDRPALTVHLADGQRLTFSIAQLQELPQASIQLRTSEGATQRWLGVPLQQLLRHIPDADNGRPLHTTALNDYSVLIPYEDIQRYDPLVAYQLDGRFMSIRDYGPLYLIYPFDDHPELHQQMFYNRSIWQLSEIHVE